MAMTKEDSFIKLDSDLNNIKLSVYRDGQKELDGLPFAVFFSIIQEHSKSSLQYASCLQLQLITACVHSEN